MRKFRSAAFEAAYEGVADLHRVGGATDEELAEMEEMCCEELVLGPEDVKRIRRSTGKSQTDFAELIGSSPGLVSKWERDEKTPSKIASKFLRTIEAHGAQIVAH